MIEANLLKKMDEAPDEEIPIMVEVPEDWIYRRAGIFGDIMRRYGLLKFLLFYITKKTKYIKVLEDKLSGKTYLVFRLPAKKIRELAGLDWVLAIYEDKIHSLPPPIEEKGLVKAFTNVNIDYLGFGKIHADKDFDGGAGIKIGILDTGIVGPNENKMASLALREDPYQPLSSKNKYRVEKFYDAIRGIEREPYDDNGHGTHCALIAAASPLNSYVGCAPKAKLYGAKVLNALGMGYTSWIIEGLNKLVEWGCHVINVSLGSDQNTDGTDPLSQAVDGAWEKGVVVVIAAGNSGPSKGSVGTPATARRIISVGATDGGRKKNGETVQSWSSRGPTIDGRPKPECVAPGYAIETHETRMSGRSGTSFAAPFVTGLAACLLSAKRDAKPDEIKRCILETCEPLGYGENVEGAGRINAWKAYQRIKAPKPEPEPEPVPEPEPEPEPEPATVVITVVKNGKAKEVYREKEPLEVRIGVD